MIASLWADEYRAQIAEIVVAQNFKRPPEPAEERLEAMLAAASRPSKTARGRGGMSLERARQMQRDAAAFDAGAARGEVSD